MTLKDKYCKVVEFNDMLLDSFRKADAKVRELTEEKVRLNEEHTKLKKYVEEVIDDVSRCPSTDVIELARRLRHYLQTT